MAGCSAPPAADFGPRNFVLGLDAPAATTTVARGSVPAGQAGVLTVSFAHLLAPAQRRLLATIADVDKVTIRIEGTGVDETATILKAAITNGQASHTFTNLPPGALTVTIKALDAAGTTIGVDIQTATVTAGNTATVTSTLRLAPGVGTERELDRTPLNPPNGGSGGSNPTTGSLQTDVTIVEPGVATATYLGAYKPPHAASVAAFMDGARIDVDAAGQVWTPWRFATTAGETTRLATITPAGVVTEIDTGLPNKINAFNRPLGQAGMTGFDRLPDLNTKLLRFDATGAQVGAPTTTIYAEQISIGPGGVAYILQGSSNNTIVSRQEPGGTVAQFRGWGPMYDFVLAAANGDAFIGEPAGATRGGQAYDDRVAVRRRSDGTVVWSRTLYSVPRDPQTMVGNFGPNVAKPSLAADGSLWCTIPDGTTLVRIAADGTRLPDVRLTHPVSRFYADATGVMWSYPGADGILTRFAADGTPAAYYYLGADIDLMSMAVTPDGHVWIHEKAQRDLLHFTVTVP